MKIGVVCETCPGEARVALTPAAVTLLGKLKSTVIVERGAGVAAGFTDEAYTRAGASLASRDEVFGDAALICQVRTLGANPTAGRDDLPRIRPGQVLVGLAEPLTAAEQSQAIARAGATLFALELVPRITRAQSMDVLSSQANVAGYKAVLIAAAAIPKFMPMFMTAAGTVTAARVLVLGAGVAGLQAIATAKRLGAIVSGYDVRSAVREQIESLGGKFVDLFPEAAAGDGEGQGGYAKAMDEAFYVKQREALAKVCAEQDVVISTAAVPGRRSPLLITRAAVEGMKPGSVIVDLAAERGGNCELSRADEVVRHQGVAIFGPTNLPATVPHDASQMFARNVVAFLTPMLADPETLTIDLDDEVVRASLVCREGAMVAPRTPQPV